MAALVVDRDRDDARGLRCGGMLSRALAWAGPRAYTRPR